ncbi:hypothetical protein AAC69_002693 [Salmonella enterica subsp. enterica serovar Hadar]|nr:hypothetical protein [Salmonella enterica subsp. enterica serovar Hadar]
MSRFREIAQELEECMCTECWGSGTQNDAEPGDIFCREWECPTCKGTGINPEYAICLDIERG